MTTAFARPPAHPYIQLRAALGKAGITRADTLPISKPYLAFLADEYSPGSLSPPGLVRE